MFYPHILRVKLHELITSGCTLGISIGEALRRLQMSFKHRVHISIFASALFALLTTFLVIPSANANGSVEISCTGDTYTVSTSTFNATSGQYCEGTLVVDGSVLSIGSGAFNFRSLLSGGLRSVTIPNSVTVIGASAFFDSPLTSLTLGNSIIDIGDSAFASTLVTSLTIPNSVELIGTYAFYSAPLTSLTIPASVTTVGELAFHLLTIIGEEDLYLAILSDKKDHGYKLVQHLYYSFTMLIPFQHFYQL